MRKQFLFSLIFAATALFARESVDHNVSFSYGVFNMTGGSIVAGNAIADSFGAENEKDDVNLLTLSSFNVAY